MSLAPGASVQLWMVAHRTDGSQVDITSTGRFISQSPETIAVSPDGIATGLKLGEARVSGDNGQFSHGREIVVVPPDTPHRFVNTGDEPLRLIAIHASSRFVTEWLEG